MLNAAAVVAILILKFNNPSTLGALDGLGNKLLAAWFQGVTPRAAGFNTLDIGALTAGTTVLMLLLMFIGDTPTQPPAG